MALKYLLDTNIISEINRTSMNASVDKKVRENFSSVAISSVIWYELMFGLHRLPESKYKRQISHYLLQVVAIQIPILPFDTQAADWFGKEQARLVSIGRTPAIADGQIAAVAVVNNLILVTRNEKDFINFHGLKLENWFEG